MSNDSANIIIGWEDLSPGNCYISYTTNPTLGDYMLNVSAINGYTESLVATLLVPTLENATQWVNDISDYWEQLFYDDETAFCSPKCYFGLPESEHE
ncbi:YIL014C-A-like protein [Saccharomyces kudriavzevii IFO 1802]|nr:YIL014C-A-like protein [Saccharomyces kudriavzevii IFO 1802]